MQLTELLGIKGHAVVAWLFPKIGETKFNSRKTKKLTISMHFERFSQRKQGRKDLSVRQPIRFRIIRAWFQFEFSEETEVVRWEYGGDPPGIVIGLRRDLRGIGSREESMKNRVQDTRRVCDVMRFTIASDWEWSIPHYFYDCRFPTEWENSIGSTELVADTVISHLFMMTDVAVYWGIKSISYMDIQVNNSLAELFQAHPSHWDVEPPTCHNIQVTVFVGKNSLRDHFQRNCDSYRNCNRHKVSSWHPP